MIGQDGCCDVATSMSRQGTDPDVHIPIYGPFFLHILAGVKTNFLASHLTEFNAIRHLAQTCGAVAASVNLIQMDMLTLLGVLLIFTPSTGMNVFVKNNVPDLTEMAEDISDAIVKLTPLALGAEQMNDAMFDQTELVNKALAWLIDTLIERLDDDMGTSGINLHTWDELPDYYNYVKGCGDMQRMAEYRQMMGSIIL
jgi:hypothetical protein